MWPLLVCIGLPVALAQSLSSHPAQPSVYPTGGLNSTSSNITWAYSQNGLSFSHTLDNPSCLSSEPALVPVTLDHHSTVDRSHPTTTALPSGYSSTSSFKTSTENTTWAYSQRNGSVHTSTPLHLSAIPTGSRSAISMNATTSNGTWAHSLKNSTFTASSSILRPSSYHSSSLLNSTVSNGSWAFSNHSRATNNILATETNTKRVFAHFMVGNVPSWGVSEWSAEIEVALTAHIDAFALNIAYGDPTNSPQIANAFAAAATTKFQLFFSFDYAGNGSWPLDDVSDLISTYSASGAYYFYKGKPFVSSFEGPDNAGDWATIKQETDCFFVPDWSSKGAKVALQLGNADGLFSWAAWPWGNTDMDTYGDASYLDFLSQPDPKNPKPYMMPVSPWFYTNMPGYKKNWLWRGDDLWRDRWEQVMMVQPDWVEIISWNDYGESHYIGSLHSTDFGAFDVGQAPFNYADGMPHDGWRQFLPYLIDTYKNGKATVIDETLVSWYRLNAAASVACSDGGTTGNTASQLQIEMSPREVAQDKIFFSALLASNADVSVTVGGVALDATWEHIPYGNVGIYHGSVAYGSNVGAVVVTVSRGGAHLMTMDGESITTDCSKNNGLMNWNAWVGYANGPAVTPTQPPLSIQEMNCTSGTAPGNFQGLCEFTCNNLGYCPLTACHCLSLGAPPKLPTPTGKVGYPIAGEGSSYLGLCNKACLYGDCPPTACGYEEVTLTEPIVSPFLPLACTGGSATDDPNYQGLCDYSCGRGYCPIHKCTCDYTGVLQPPEAKNASIQGEAFDITDDTYICDFTCSRDYCPPAVCYSNQDDDPGCDIDGDGLDGCADTPDPCDPLLTFDSLDSLQQASSGMPPYCAAKYSLGVLGNMLADAVSNYSSVNDGYDTEFNNYQQYIKDEMQTGINNFMFNQTGAKYFSCIFEDSEKRNTTSHPCTFFDSTWTDTYSIFTLYYTLTDADGFYTDLLNTTGIEKDWIKFDTVPLNQAGCTPQSLGTGCERTNQILINYPKKLSDDDITVPNPKDTIAKVMPNMNSIGLTLLATQMDVSLGNWNGSLNDINQVMSMPIFLLIQGIDAMQQVKNIGSAIEDDKKRNLILTIISAVLFFLPLLGDISEAVAEATILARILSMISMTGNSAVAIMEIVKDPQAAPLTIMELMVGAGFTRTDRDFEAMATKRTGILSKDIAKMGSLFKSEDDVLQNIIGVCAARR